MIGKMIGKSIVYYRHDGWCMPYKCGTRISQTFYHRTSYIHLNNPTKLKIFQQ